ncbi:MAG: sarcosine oxidase subunit gamma family protein [Pseudomonadota bacterium]
MSEAVSALGGRVAEPRPGLAIRDMGLRGQITLKADLTEPAVATAVETVAHVPLPSKLSAAFAEDGRGAVWMAADEMLIFVPKAEVSAALEALEAALADLHHMALDVSDARAVLRLSGRPVAEVLAKGAPVDLRASAFPVGRARRTHLAGLAVGLWRRGEDDWDIVCFRSYAHHLFDWLVRVGGEGAAVDHPPMGSEA